MIPVRHFERIDSTNLEARRLADEGMHGPLWLRADEQTGGRGRLGRTWVSPPGNLYATLLMPLEGPIARAPQAGFVVALAVHDVVSQFAAGALVGLKWPNDCLVDGRKIAGVLCEVVQANPVVLALGCGINVASAPEDLAYPTTSIAALSGPQNVDAVFEAYCDALKQRLAQWAAGFESIANAWRERAIGIGEQVFVTGHETAKQGIFTGIADDGAMLLRTGGGMQKIHAGDVSIPSLDSLRRRP